ncbi:hypothetical protein A4X03_0g7019 [Tilletia caries]|uniref:Uncharacterized protein n=1 Tax=Tilletia caries TaxID=13290 RepID=A0A177TZC1_9BASI|nr:hypothetical protein A4X03_0g7019 [Tilletia caries]
MTTSKSNTVTSNPTSTKTTTTTTSSTKTTTKTTAAPLPLGAPCSTHPSCQSGYCRAKLNRDGTRETQADCDVKKDSGASCYQNTGLCQWDLI